MGIKLTSGTRGKLNIVPFITRCGSTIGVAFYKGVPEEAYARRCIADFVKKQFIKPLKSVVFLL